jgi:hypothetical protein
MPTKLVQNNRLSALFRRIGAIEGAFLCVVASLLLAVALCLIPNESIEHDVVAGSSLNQSANIQSAPSIDLKQEFELAEAARQEALAQAKQFVEWDLQYFVDNLDVTAFSEEVLGWNSKFKLIGGTAEHRDWIRDKFAELVMPPDYLAGMLSARMNELHEWLTQIDNTFLIRVQADVDIDSLSLEPPTLNMEGVESAVSNLIAKAEESAWASVSELLVSTGAGWAAGEMVAGTWNGDTNQFDYQSTQSNNNQWLGFIGGVLAGLATDFIVSTVADTQGQLEEKLISAIAEMAENMSHDEDTSSFWREPMEELTQYHREMCKLAVKEMVSQ